MALPRRALLSSLAAAAVAGCVADEPAGSESSPTASDSPTGTEPGYASCNPDLLTAEQLDTAGGIPEPLGEPEAGSYARELEQDIALPPPDERDDGYLSIGSNEVETVEYGYLVTVEVTGGYYNQTQGTATVHADLGQYIATYFINEQVVRRAKNTTAELDPRQSGEVVVCESA